MKHLKANTNDEADEEKHVPVYDLDKYIAHIKVGEKIHPSSEGHYIKWITIITNKGRYTRILSPNDRPEVYLTLENDEVIKEVMAYCNLHGLWKNK